MCLRCDAVRSISADLDDALNACDTDEVNVLIDELQTFIGVDAMQPLLRSIITAAVTHIGVHHQAPVVSLN